mmetsp:Transcript_99891/g.268317  ORF Transcript_99891/g.268317 Transcript_99891/m.268317 type:complete len:335 (+) Transcript_99891:84-1088(+)
MSGKGSATRVQQWASSVASPTEVTLVLHGIPKDCARASFRDWLDSTGFDERYDFLYLPRCFSTHQCMGYAFINFTDAEASDRFTKIMDGSPQRDGSIYSVTSSTTQGLAANLLKWVRARWRRIRDPEVLPYVRQLERLGVHPCDVGMHVGQAGQVPAAMGEPRGRQATSDDSGVITTAPVRDPVFGVDYDEYDSGVITPAFVHANHGEDHAAIEWQVPRTSMQASGSPSASSSSWGLQAPSALRNEATPWYSEASVSTYRSGDSGGCTVDYPPRSLGLGMTARGALPFRGGGGVGAAPVRAPPQDPRIHPHWHIAGAHNDLDVGEYVVLARFSA